MGVTRRRDRLEATLLGTAVGDALGLPVEGMSARDIECRWGRVDRYLWLGGTGIVSDDTELTALVAQSLVRGRLEPHATVMAFRRALVGWVWRLPWGIGWGTLRAGIRATLGFRRSGVGSAGNGAAMRAAIVGVALADDTAGREALGRALAMVTHVDPRAVEGALFVAEVAARAAHACVRTGDVRRACVEGALPLAPSLAPSVAEAVALFESNADVARAATQLGSSGFVVHTVGLATFLFLRHGDDSRDALVQTASAGGDTDSIAAIVGAWCGALGTPLPEELVDGLRGGPFGPAHLRALAADLAGDSSRPASFAWPLAMAWNLALYPLVLGHAIVRLLPFRRVVRAGRQPPMRPRS